MLEIFREAFKDGCGLSLDKILQSKEYEKLSNREKSLCKKYPKDTDKGIAFRAGHLVMGKLFNMLDERDAIRQASLNLAQSLNSECRALIHLLGKRIISEAKKCLPQEAVNMAKEWKSASCERQIDIARELYFLFNSDSQRMDREMNFETMYRIVMKDINRYEDSRKSVLPQLYGKWNKENNLPNCQGKTQMLIAFARLAGARALVIEPIISARQIIKKWRGEFCKKLQNDIINRNLFPDEALHESMQAELFLYQFKNLRLEDFHLGAALQLKDHRWVLIDSHGLDWGIFPDVWQVDDIYRMLYKYREVLPGLSIIGHDHGIANALCQKESQKIEDLLGRSRKMEKDLRDKGNPFDAIRYLADSDDLELIIRGFSGEKILDNLDDEWRLLSAVVLLTGQTGQESFSILGPIISLMRNKDLWEERLGSLLTTYHCIAMNGFKDQLSDDGKLIHAVCEFSLPEYSIAISIINSLNCDNHKVGQDFFIDNSFDQLSLCNTLHEFYRGSNLELAQAAAETLRELPFMHSRCKRLLEILDRREL